MTPEQQRWCESKIGHTITKNRVGRGTIVDYKGDTVGWGCFFIVMFDDGPEEVCHPYPPALRRRGTDDAFSIRAQRKETK